MNELARATLDRLYEETRRTSFEQPGFAWIDLDASGRSSAGFRQLIRDLVRNFQDRYRAEIGGVLCIRSATVFNQQVTTKFHLDGGPPQSLLILGYEPSTVRSRLLLADYARLADQLGLTPREFLDRHNPMYADTEALLEPYTTELPMQSEQHYRIVCICNSSLPPGDRRSLGVLHKAIIVNPDPNSARVVGSIMLSEEIVDNGETDASLLEAFIDRPFD